MGHSVHPDAIKHNDVGNQYLNEGRCVEAEERFRLALEYGENFEHPHNGLGMVAMLCNNDLDRAAQHFKDGLNVNPDFAEAHNNLGVTFIKRDPPMYDQACEEFKAAVEIDPANLNGRENYGFCLMRRGIIAGDKGDPEARKDYFKDAKSQLIRLIELAPDNYNAHHHMGLMALVDKQYEVAEQRFHRCLEIDRENPICCYNLGNVFLATARCDEAIQAYICALRAGAQSEVSIDSRSNLGISYEMCAKKDGAIKTFLDRIKSDPGNPANHFDLGSIYADKGLLEQAVNEWENATKLDPLYCPAYYEVAMVANKNLDSTKTIDRCKQFVACVGERKDGPAQWTDKADQCKSLVKKLEME
ncbi:MAG: hypothetical protein HYV07_25945 [Deltaproteobacteria bacterium]|nr:hypothetical protein [Deltaproteobacteria bacterium]